MAEGNPVNTSEVKVTLGDGTIVIGKDMDEAFANLSKMKVDTANALKTERDALATEKAERERLAAEAKAFKDELDALKNPVKTTPVDNKTFNKDTYFQILGEDPMRAQDYVDSFRFGVDSPDKVRETFNNMRRDISNVSSQVDVFTQQAVAASFLATHDDFPTSDPNAAKLLTDKVKNLTESGIPYNTDTVSFAYYTLIRDKKITPVEKKEVPPEENNSPNPSLSGAGGGTIDATEVQKAEAMSDADLLKLLQSKGMFR